MVDDVEHNVWFAYFTWKHLTTYDLMLIKLIFGGSRGRRPCTPTEPSHIQISLEKSRKTQTPRTLVMCFTSFVALAKVGMPPIRNPGSGTVNSMLSPELFDQNT